MSEIRTVFGKEFNSFFTSPAAWLFLAMFLVVNLFVFFWGAAFFARNVADMKPLFQWMPILLIFLVAALTMRSWSEERRAGTLESLLTSPVSPWHLILGKFFASLALVALALLLTAPLPITVSLIGPLDWGPVIGGYVASLFLAAAYISMGLYASSRTDNPIVALILTVALAGAFYLIGSSLITTLFGQTVGGVLALIGSGSRFDSITRGVFDIRDIYYYLSLVGIFLSLNRLSLQRLSWAGKPFSAGHRRWGWLVGLAIINFALANVWLNAVGGVRLDLTRDKLYSLSPATHRYLQQLQEPLLIRGYFSAKTHPLLEPLVPQIKDLLKEYQVAGGDKVRVEFIDPHTDQTLEQEAAQKYGVRPVPFRMASRYQSGVVNSYFDLVIAYGDQYEKLTYSDLIEIKSRGEGDPEVLLKNPEYAITRAIRKVANAYQSGGNVFASLSKPVTFKGYISAPQKLPKSLATLQKQLKTTLQDLKKSAGDKLRIEFADPDANGGKLAKTLQQDYGFEPQIASLFDPKPFWFYMLLTSDDSTVQIALPEQLDGAALKKSIVAAVQRLAPGYLKTVAIVTPPQPMTNPMMRRLGMASGGKSYEKLRAVLADNVRLKDTDLKNGHVPADADLLLLLAPQKLDDKQLFAVDQFLMQGGAVLVATSPFDVDLAAGQLKAKKQDSGLQDWLKHQGLTIADSMVLDEQNASIPIPVQRNLGGLTIQEIRMMPYPHFPDLRGDELNPDNPVTASLGQLTLNWASPIELARQQPTSRKVTELLHSSDKSWTSASLNLAPDYQRYPKTGFKPGQKRARHTLAVALQGGFESYFKGKPSPLLKQKQDKKDAKDKGDAAKPDKEDKTIVSSLIEHASDSARLIVVASNTFATDSAINLASQGLGTQYTRPLAFIQNAIDWSLDDPGLLAIRGRARFARTLMPMDQSTREFWEYLNYALALFGLSLVGLWRHMRQKRRQAHYQHILAEV